MRTVVEVDSKIAAVDGVAVDSVSKVVVGVVVEMMVD